MSNFQFTLSSGRKIGVTALGDPSATNVVVFCHSAPGSGVFDPDPVASAGTGVHIVAIDRPGYGSSDPLPAGEWPTVSGAANDISEYLHAAEGTAQALNLSELDSIGVVGWSAGGRVALALAAQHPSLIHLVVVIGTPAPNEAVEWIPKEQAEASEQLSKLPADAAIEKLTGQFAKQAGDQVPSSNRDVPVSLTALGVSDADTEALARPGVRDRLDAMVRDAFRQGTIGVVSDILSYTARPWGFDLGDVAARTLLLYGGADPIVGEAHARWYEQNLLHARVELAPDAGHLLVAPQWERALAHLTSTD